MTSADRRKWDARYRARGAATREPDPFLRSLDAVLPRSGQALDVAGGTGRHALWLAARGLEVTVVDVSEVGLEIARAHAREAGLAIHTACVDLATEPLPLGPWDVAVVFHYLQRPLYAALADVLAPGGWLVACHPTRRNLERHDRPPAHFVLEEGELPGLLRGVEIVSAWEGWTAEGRHEAQVVARRR